MRKVLNFNDGLSWVSFCILILASLFPLKDLTYFFPLAAIFLAVGITSAVHNAETIAQRVGPSMGTLILALSVTVIELALIVSLMGNSGDGSATIARDTVFAAIMIVTNGIIGICILLGGIRFRELGFQAIGTTALLGVLAVLATTTLVLPNFTVSTLGPTYGPGQLIFVSIAALALYGALVWSQTKTHKVYFEALSDSEMLAQDKTILRPSGLRAGISFVGLLLSLIAVVGLAKLISPAIEAGITNIGAPKSVVGAIVALLVLAPEALAAIKAAKSNQLQTSLNLALGSGAASIALTIPAVSLYSLSTGLPLALGLDSKGIVFLMLTFITAGLTFGSGRTTALHGIVHLVILASYLAISFMP